MKLFIHSLNDNLDDHQKLNPAEVDQLANKAHQGLLASTTLCEATLSQELQAIINTELDTIIGMPTAPSESDHLLSQSQNNYGENSSDDDDESEIELRDSRSFNPKGSGK